MSAFAIFSLKAPSLLAFDEHRAEGNLGTIYGIERVPCDTYLRERLDPVSPESLRSSFKGVFRQLQRGKALDAMAFLDGHYLVSLDGTGYFASKTIHCASCLVPSRVGKAGAVNACCGIKEFLKAWMAITTHQCFPFPMSGIQPSSTPKMMISTRPTKNPGSDKPSKAMILPTLSRSVCRC